MAEYIERDALALKVRRYLMPNVDIDGTVTVENAERYFLKLLEDAPAADVVEVRRGEWTAKMYTAHCSCGKSYKTAKYECSVCKRIADMQPYGLNFCPNCGADMRGEKDGRLRSSKD